MDLRAAQKANSATWVGQADSLKIEVRLNDILSPKQVKLIHSGFETLSELTLYREGRRDEPLTHVRCHVVFDTWEELYKVTILAEGGQSEQKTVKTFERYAEICLSARVPVVSPQVGSIQANLQVNQLSGEQKEHLREWLVKQQSGMMQGLFAHMLGDISIVEEVDVTVVLPPYVGEQMQGQTKARGLIPKPHEGAP